MRTEEIKATIKQRLSMNRVYLDTEFIFGELIDAPNIKGVFEVKSHWFLYSTDEKKAITITGPFSDNEIIFATSMLMQKSEFFGDYQFDEDAIHRYVYNHYSSLEDAIKGIKD